MNLFSEFSSRSGAEIRRLRRDPVPGPSQESAHARYRAVLSALSDDASVLSIGAPLRSGLCQGLGLMPPDTDAHSNHDRKGSGRARPGNLGNHVISSDWIRPR